MLLLSPRAAGSAAPPPPTPSWWASPAGNNHHKVYEGPTVVLNRFFAVWHSSNTLRTHRGAEQILRLVALVEDDERAVVPARPQPLDHLSQPRSGDHDVLGLGGSFRQLRRFHLGFDTDIWCP
eukprot:6574978-Pyramimonas_sp.AAC.1